MSRKFLIANMTTPDTWLLLWNSRYILLCLLKVFPKYQRDKSCVSFIHGISFAVSKFALELWRILLINLMNECTDHLISWLMLSILQGKHSPWPAAEGCIRVSDKGNDGDLSWPRCPDPREPTPGWPGQGRRDQAAPQRLRQHSGREAGGSSEAVQGVWPGMEGCILRGVEALSW